MGNSDINWSAPKSKEERIELMKQFSYEVMYKDSRGGGGGEYVSTEGKAKHRVLVLSDPSYNFSDISYRKLMDDEKALLVDIFTGKPFAKYDIEKKKLTVDEKEFEKKLNEDSNRRFVST